MDLDASYTDLVLTIEDQVLTLMPAPFFSSREKIDRGPAGRIAVTPHSALEAKRKVFSLWRSSPEDP